MRARTILAMLVAAGVIVLAAVGDWRVRHMPADLCPLSGRPIHAETRTRVRLNGHQYETCCIRCALTQARQASQSLRILTVADFETGGPLNPAEAWYVEGSAVNVCMSTTPAAQSPTRHDVYVRGFDRCAPSVLAFPDEGRARAFATRHGGIVKRLADVEHEVHP